MFSASPAFGGGTPDPSNVALSTTNRNALMEMLGPDRGFGFGDYLTDRVSGLQRGGAVETYDFYIEVPPGQTQLVLQIFDADAGAGDNLATPIVNEDLHDENNATGNWEMSTTYQLFDPSGVSVAIRNLPGQDCDPATAGLQSFCDNAWSDLGAFTIPNPAPGHWRLAIGSPNTALTSEDESNSYGLRAHDGDASASGNEFPIYANTFVGVGQVYTSSAGADPGFSRTHDFFPFIRRDCTCESNDFDSDSSAPIDESTVFTTRTGATPTGSNGTLSLATLWRQNVLTNWTTEQDANDYGLWRLRWTTGRFNHITYYMGDDTNFDPSNAAPGPGNGVEPNSNPENGAIRLYLPADGSRLFGLAGGANDAVNAPLKPWVGHSWALVAGEPPIEANVTSIVRMTITVANPTAYPIQFSNVTGGPNVIVATLPDNGGQTTYVAGSATITGGAATATSVTGTGPWTLTFAPGVIAAGVTATLTYDIQVRPTATGLPKSLFFVGTFGTATQGSYIDETCANASGGASVCGATALTNATLSIGPLCRLTALVTTAPSLAVAKQINGTVTDNGNGTFTVPFRLVVENLGTTTMTPLQVTDDLAAAFPAPSSVVGVTAVSTSILSGVGTLIGNGAYNGVGDTNLLSAGGSSLNAGAAGQIDFSVTFNPNGMPGPFFNQAIASGTTSLGGTFVDSSDDGTDPDPDGDGIGNEAGTGCPSTVAATNCENDATPIQVSGANAIGLAKQVSNIINNGNGTFTASFVLTVENVGSLNFTSVQVTDDLVATFPAPASVVSVTTPAVSIVSGVGTLAPNGAFNGTSDTNLLNSGSSTLNLGAVGQISFDVTFNPAGSANFSNSAIAAGSNTTGNVTDTSDDGTDPDPDGDGNANEPGENDATPIHVNAANAIGLAKQVGNIVDNGNGTFTASFVLTVENVGSLNFTSVQVTDDLVATFPAPASVVSVTTPAVSILSGVGTLAPNGAFNGASDTNLLNSGSSTLNLGATGQISFDVTFNPAGQTNFFNAALASGSNLSGNVTDASDNGADPDQDGDGNANEPGENDATPITVTIIAGPIRDVPVVNDIRVWLLLIAVLGILGAVSLRRAAD
ncbi:hypothetical protein C7S18_10345 [Ahniella affigens]|uniref:DUF11 domain-containing protein n=2 Tax=Ahniella affigens TaxID=2021234 RepID=A0A2P1PRW0_9GAMM|nr:hypothetical protein C7S18_10345 [Ahniella affigens]